MPPGEGLPDAMGSAPLGKHHGVAADGGPRINVFAWRAPGPGAQFRLAGELESPQLNLGVRWRQDTVCRSHSRALSSGQTSSCERAMGQTVELMDRITVNPDQCGGRPCVRGMRIRVIDVLDLLAAGLTTEQVIEELPDLEPADVTACLRFASRRLDHPVLAA